MSDIGAPDSVAAALSPGRLADRLERLWRWAAQPADGLSIGLALAGVAVVVLGPLFLTRGLYLQTMPHDSLSMADIGYRMAAGQVPGRDFHSAFGVMFQWQMGLAMRLGRTVAWTLKLATLLFLLFAAPFAAYLARSRLSNLGALAVVFSALTLGAAPYAKADHYLYGATFAMLYNREAWALLLLTVLFWLPSRRLGKGAGRPVLDAVLLGLLVATCLYAKVSYGGLGLIFGATWLLARRAPIAVMAAWIATMVAVAVVAELVNGPGFNLTYLLDILSVMRAGGARIAHIAYNVFDARFELAAACVLIPLAVPARLRPSRIDYLFVLGTAICSLLIVWQNAQIEGLVLLWAGVAAVLEPAIAAPAPTTGKWPFVATAAGLYAAWAVATVGPSGLAMLDYVHGQISLAPQAPSIPMIADIRFQPARPGETIPGNVDGGAYAEALTDGVALLAACPPQARVFTVDVFEPFAMLTHRPPGLGWSWHDPGHSFTVLAHPAAAAEFSGVGCVMVPREPTKQTSTAGLLDIYGGYIAQTFPKTVESRHWILRLRNPQPPVPPSIEPEAAAHG